MEKKNTLSILLILFVTAVISIVYFYYNNDVTLNNTEESFHSEEHGHSEEHDNSEKTTSNENETIDNDNQDKINVDVSTFNLYDMSGNTTPIANLKKKVNLLYFWTSWCPDCKISNKKLKEIEDKMIMENSEIKNKIKFITINIDTDTEIAKKYIKENAYPFDVFFDIDSSLSTHLNVKSIPTVYVANSDFITVAKLNILNNNEEIIAQIKSYL